MCPKAAAMALALASLEVFGSHLAEGSYHFGAVTHSTAVEASSISIVAHAITLTVEEGQARGPLAPRAPTCLTRPAHYARLLRLGLRLC